MSNETVESQIVDEVFWERFLQWQKIKPGTVLRNTLHPEYPLVVITHRKDDDTGWWCEGGGGLWDRVLLSGRWEVISYAPSATDGRSFDRPPR